MVYVWMICMMHSNFLKKHIYILPKLSLGAYLWLAGSPISPMFSAANQISVNPLLSSLPKYTDACYFAPACTCVFLPERRHGSIEY